MKEILDKISSYNIFNYLFPGVIFTIITKQITSYNFLQEDNISGAFLYYFIGMTISRFGSVVLETLLKKTKFLNFSDYGKFVAASKIDTKIDTFSELNNTYRTLYSMIFLLLILKVYDFTANKFDFDKDISIFILLFLTFLLYLFSHRKQSEYITKRVNIHHSNNNPI